MSDEDFQTGLRGGTYSPSMNYADWYAGHAEHEVQRGPKTEIDGVGFTALLTAHLLAIMYPVAGAITAACGAGAFLLIREVVPSSFPGAVVGAIVVGLVAMHFGVKAEHSMSRSRTYRVLRHALRMLLFGGAILAGMFPELNGGATGPPTPGTIGTGLMAIIAMHFLFRALDRRLFPVRDRKAIAQEQKYAELSDDEIFAIKNAKFHGILWFGAAWFVLLVALISVFREGVPAVLLIAGSFLVLLPLRKRLFFRVHQQRLAQAAVLREQRRGAFENASPPAGELPGA